MKKYDVIIVGGGASGLMCAANLSKKISVAILEANDKPAKKVKISGGGKCNLTNEFVSSNNYNGESGCIEQVLKTFSKQHLLRFAQRNNIELELRKERYYFCKNSSDDMIEALLRCTKNADIYYNTSLQHITKESELFKLESSGGTFEARSVVVATGGASFAQVGASDIGLRVAQSFALQTKPFHPALVGLSVQKEQFWMRELSGLSCRVELRVGTKKLQEDMLFTHKGISGPVVLSASLYWQKGEIVCDFFPNEDLLKKIEGSKKHLSSALALPKRLAKALLDVVGVDDVEVSKLTKEQKEKLLGLKHYAFAPAGNFGLSKAEVCRGGVLSCELDCATMMSKKVQNLYFIGEVVDVTGELGGYNFQWAFSSGVVCAKALKRFGV